MPCIWEEIRFYTNDSTLSNGTFEGRVTGCASNRVIVSFPDYPGLQPIPMDVNPDGTFGKQIKIQPFGIRCDDQIRVKIECYGSTDPSCAWDSQVSLECFLCPTPYLEIAPLGEDFIGLDQFSQYANLQQADGSPAPECNLNGVYRLRIQLNGLQANITWIEDIIDGSGSPAQELAGTTNQTEIDYNLDAPSGVFVLVQALVEPIGDSAECPTTPLAVYFQGCGPVDCEDFGFFDSSVPGECTRCPEGQHWDSHKQECVDDDQSQTPGEPSEPKLKFCKCEHWWCYALGALLAIAVGLYLLGASNCFTIDDISAMASAIQVAISGGIGVATLIDTLGVGTFIILFWRLCGSCCTACFLILGIVLGVLAVVAQSVASGFPQCLANPSLFPTIGPYAFAGLIAFVAIIVITIAYATECGEHD